MNQMSAKDFVKWSHFIKIVIEIKYKKKTLKEKLFLFFQLTSVRS